MKCRKKRPMAVLLCICCFESCVVHAVDFVAKEDFQDKFVRDISIANEYLEESDPPRFKLVSAEVELSLVNEETAGGGLKIPIIPVGGDANVLSVRRSKETYTYIPRSSVQVSGDDDLGLISYVRSLQEELHGNSSSVVLARVVKEEVFVVKYTANGKVSFFNVVSIGGGVTNEHIHRAKFTFCLEGQTGDCADQ